jgi:hypothetical protein
VAVRAVGQPGNAAGVAGAAGQTGRSAVQVRSVACFAAGRVVEKCISVGLGSVPVYRMGVFLIINRPVDVFSTGTVDFTGHVHCLDVAGIAVRVCAMGSRRRISVAGAACGLGTVNGGP